MKGDTGNKLLALLPAAGLLVAGGIAFGTLRAETQGLKGTVTTLQADVEKQKDLNRKLSHELGQLSERSNLSITQGQLIQGQLFEILTNIRSERRR